MTFITHLSNFGLKLGLNYCFPLNGAPELMRRRFDKLAGASKEQLKEQFSNAVFEEISIGERSAELISAGW
jgi:hypothetical protein